ncbi:MAG: hypothetical protein Q4D96_04470 [Propionibacteriaceae bacterium]|nr:hypothetical protein [Propionibacteriaceae bacterium]
MSSPRVGTVYGIFDHRHQRWGLAQLVGMEARSKSWLSLDHFEPELPESLDGIRPLRAHRYSFDGETAVITSDSRVPHFFRELGWLPPLVTDWPLQWGAFFASDARHEWLWQQRGGPQVKAELGERPAMLTLNGTRQRVPRGWINDEVLDAPLEELKQLRWATGITLERPYPHLMELITALPLLHQVRVEVELPGLQLPPQVDELELSFPVPVEWDGPWLELTAPAPVAIPGTTDLTLTGEHFDLAELASTYPRLHQLTLQGAPAMVANIEALSSWPELRHLRMTDCFGFDALPELPQLEHCYLSSIPETAGRAARRTYKGRETSIRQLRTPEWVAENWHNPFREWTGSQHRSSRYATRAFTAWKQQRRRLLDAAQEAQPETWQERVAEELREAAAQFHTWNRSEWVETEERETIFEAYRHLLTEITEARALDVEAALDALGAAMYRLGL